MTTNIVEWKCPFCKLVKEEKEGVIKAYSELEKHLVEEHTQTAYKVIIPLLAKKEVELVIHNNIFLFSNFVKYK